MKVHEIIRRIEDDGWRHVRTKGSHRQFKHDGKPGVVTVSGHRNDDVAIGTLNNMFKQAGLEK